MKNLVSALSMALMITCYVFICNNPSEAATRTTPAISKALAKCKDLLRLSPAQLAKVAKNNHTTVAYIHNGCYTLQHRDEVAQDPDFALAGCRRYGRMSDRQLSTVARQSNTSVARIRHACYILQHPESSGGYTSSDRSGSTTSPTPEPTPSLCQCGAFQVCVSQAGFWRCTDKESNDNKCGSSYDCQGVFSSCVSGKCN